MSGTEVVDAIAGTVAKAVAASDWPRAHAAVEQLTVAAARAIANHDAERADAIVGTAAGAASRLSLEADVPAKPSATSVVWLLRCVAAIAEAGRQGLPAAGDGHTRDLISRRLQAVGATGATNSELVAACGRSPETISRVLRQMRLQGSVEYQSVGRARRNWLAGSRPAAGNPRDTVDVDWSRLAAAVVAADLAGDVVTPAEEFIDGTRHEPLPAATSARELAEAF